MSTAPDDFVASLSPHLFWDVAVSDLDPRAHHALVIRRVLEYGTYRDWLALKAHYNLEKIAEVAVNTRGLDPRAATFVACVARVPRESFRCFTQTSSPGSYWIS